MPKALITNLTRRTSDLQAMRQFRAKLELEVRFQRKVKKLLDTMTREFDDLYSNVGLILPAEAFFPNWKDLLIEIYVETTKIFSRSIRFGTKSKKEFHVKQTNVEVTDTESAKVEAEIAAAMAIWIDETSTEQAKLITATNNDLINQSVSRAKRELSEAMQFIEPAAVAAIATPHLASFTPARSNLIAMQEVGVSQSQSQFTEASMVNSSDAFVEGQSIRGKVLKGWNAILDNVTRPGHANADFTYALFPIPAIDNFIVTGESLKFPRDPNGSPGNIINCRCEAVYSFT